MSEGSENQGSGGIPPRATWLEELESVRTKRAYESAISDFVEFLGEESSQRLAAVTRKDVEAWRDDLAERKMSPSTIRSKMAAVSYLYDLLAEREILPANPVAGVKRPAGKSEKRVSSSVAREGFKKLLDLPSKDTVRGLRDRAILAVLAHHEISPEEISLLKVGDLQEREGDSLPCFFIREIGGTVRSVLIHAGALQRIYQYLARVDQQNDPPLFRPIRNNVTKTLDSSLTASGIRKGVVKYWQERLKEPS